MTQRQEYKLKIDGKKSSLTNLRMRLLNDCGFVWDLNQEKWNIKYQELIGFKEVHKHTNVRNGYKIDKSFYSWTKQQRHLNCKGTLKSERINLMDALDFDWRS